MYIQAFLTEPDLYSTADSGLYQLVIRIREARHIRVGNHGNFFFNAGYYVYTGSANRHLQSRIARHLRRKKKMRWHIDYLLRHGRVLQVKRYINRQSECELNRKVAKIPGSLIPAPGFGSSDCKCPAHLFYFRRNPAKKLG
jgi:sugar fermentation stimulation protein A